jgi:TetR/AcrR family transcriptional repressor of nem operon
MALRTPAIPHESRTRFLDAALRVIRAKGYNATMVQEAYETHPAIRAACDGHISAHAAAVTKDILEAKRRYAPKASWSTESLGLHTQAVLQGAFILAKAKNGPEVAVDSLHHLRRYLQLLFTRPQRKEGRS